MVDTSILQGLPCVEAVVNNILQLQDDFDRLRTAYWDSDEDIVFNRVIHNGVDPERVLSTRASHLVMQSNASLVNHYKGWVKAYKSSRDAALAANDNDPGLLPPHGGE